MKSFRFLAVALCSLAVVPALAQYPQAWSSFKDLGQTTNDTPAKILPAPSGGYFICGYDSGSTVITKLDDTGVATWTRLCPGINSDMYVNSAGVAVVGTVESYLDTYENFTEAVFVQHYDLSGNLIWSKSLTNFGNITGAPNCSVAQDLAGNVFVEENYGQLIKLDAGTGAQQWLQPVSESYYPASLGTDSNGSVYAALDGIDGLDVHAFSAAGAPLWKRVLAGSSAKLGMDNAGNVMVMYRLGGYSGSNVTKYDSSGNLLWTATTTSPGYLVWGAMSSTGSAFVGGENGSPGTYGAEFNSSGGTNWSLPFANDIGASAFDSSGDIYTATSSSLTRIDGSGNVLWSTPISGVSLGGQVQLVADSLGRAAVLYQTGTPHNSDLGVQVFSNTGALVWEHAYDAHRSLDKSWGSTTDASGNTYVAAEAAGGSDLLAVARFSSTGGVSWSRILPQLSDFPRVVGPRLAAGGGIVVGQYSLNQSPTNGIDMGIYRFDASGNLLWAYSDSSSLQKIEDIKVATDGTIYVSIAYYGSTSNDNSSNLRVLKLDASGKLLWEKDRSDKVLSAVNVANLTLDAFGNAYVSFPTELTQNFLDKPTVTKLDKNGNLLWSTLTPDPDPDDTTSIGDDIALDSAGNSFLLANYMEVTYLYKFDPSGNYQWGIPIDKQTDNPRLAIDSLNNLFVLGFGGGNPFGLELQKFNTSGVRSWAWVLPAGVDFQHVLPIIVDGLGGAYVASEERGASANTTNLISHVNADGLALWPVSGGLFASGAISRFSDVINSKMAGLGLDAAGDVYTAGAAYSSTGSYDLNVIKYASAGSAAVSQNVPFSMVAGQTYQISETFENSGFETWTTAAGYKLSVINGATFGVTNAFLAAADSITPGQTKKFSFFAYAPTVAGVYSFQAKMNRNGSTFGSASTTVGVTVTVAANAARYVSQSLPTSVTAGSTFTVKVDMRNVGSNVWSMVAEDALAPATGYPNWNVSSVALAPSDAIAQGSDKVFTFTCTAPATAGSYTMRWQMKNGSGYFGDRTTVKTITVTP